MNNSLATELKSSPKLTTPPCTRATFTGSLKLTVGGINETSGGTNTKEIIDTALRDALSRAM